MIEILVYYNKHIPPPPLTEISDERVISLFEIAFWLVRTTRYAWGGGGGLKLENLWSKKQSPNLLAGNTQGLITKKQAKPEGGGDEDIAVVQISMLIENLLKIYDSMSGEGRASGWWGFLYQKGEYWLKFQCLSRIYRGFTVYRRGGDEGLGGMCNKKKKKIISSWFGLLKRAIAIIWFIIKTTITIFSLFSSNHPLGSRASLRFKKDWISR